MYGLEPPSSSIYVVALVFVSSIFWLLIVASTGVKACLCAALSSVGVNFFGGIPQLPFSLMAFVIALHPPPSPFAAYFRAESFYLGRKNTLLPKVYWPHCFPPWRLLGLLDFASGDLVIHIWLSRALCFTRAHIGTTYQYVKVKPLRGAARPLSYWQAVPLGAHYHTAPEVPSYE